MQDLNSTSAKPLLSKALLPLSFFAFYFLSVYLIVNPALIYHGGSTITNFPPFFTTQQFLHEHLTRPAGPAQYIYAFIAQFFNFNAAGALIITAQAWLIFIALTHISKKLNATALAHLSYLPPLIILFLYNHYTFHFAAFNTIAVQLVLFCLYLKLPTKIKPIALIITSPIIYYALGPSLLYLVLLCVIYELLLSKNYINAIIYAAQAAIIPYVIGVMYCDISLIDSYCDLLPFSWKTSSFIDRAKLLNFVYLLYILPVAIILLASPFSLIKNKSLKAKNKKQAPKNHPAQKNTNPFYKTATLVATLAITLTATSLSCDKKQKTFFAIDYYSYHKNWQKVLDLAEKLPNNFFAVHHATSALYHLSQLNEDMFKYTQHPDALLFTDNKTNSTGLTTFDVYLDLGIINLAEHYLARNISRLGERDIFLQRLAWINMIKGNNETAKTFLTALSKTLFQKEWANKQLNAIKQDPSLASYEEIQSARKNMLRKDVGMATITQEDFLTSLLEANPKNKMAFDYLMAWYIITKNTNQFISYLDQLPNFGYKQLPTVYQLAILMHTYSTKKDINLQGYEIPQQTIQYAKQFYALMNQYTGNEQLQLKILNEKYGDTYLYYFVRKFNRMPEFTGRPK